MKKIFFSSAIIFTLLFSCTDLQKLNILKKTDQIYLTVGKNNCDYTSLHDAVEAFTDDYDLIYVMDPRLIATGIRIEKNVTISGFGIEKTKIMGGETAEDAPDRVFLIEESGALILKNISITNGQSTGEFRRGGAILNHGYLSMENCLISESLAVYGAGILNRGTLEMKNCRVEDNHTIPANAAEIKSALGCTGSGGGIKNEPNGILTMENCVLSRNSSRKKGGGIFMSCESKNVLSNCRFTENSSVFNGGAIQLRGDLVMKNCTIENNSSVKGVGGFYNYGKLSFSGNVIQNNYGGDFQNGKGDFGLYGEGILEHDQDNKIGKRLN